MNRRLEILGYDLKGAVALTELHDHLGNPANDRSVIARLAKRFLITPPAEGGHLAGPKEQMIAALHWQDADTAGFRTHAAELKTHGFRVLADVDASANPPPEVRRDAAFLRIQGRGLGRALEQACSRLSAQGNKVIVAGLPDNRSFEQAALSGAEFFQGFFFNEPSVEAGRALNPNYANIAALMQLTRDNAPAAKLEQVLKRDATLSFRLLRYINSAGFGLSCEIQSFRHAIAVLGYQNLYRWLALLLVTAARQSAAPALVTTAITRGRLGELLAEGLLGGDEADNLFIVGAFSLLPAIMRTPIEKLVEQIPLGEAVVDALFRREGPYGPFLRVVELLEDPRADESTADEIMELASLLGLTARSLNQRQLEAIAWAESLA